MLPMYLFVDIAEAMRTEGGATTSTGTQRDLCAGHCCRPTGYQEA